MSTTAAAILTAVSKLDPTGIASKVMDIVTTIHSKYGQMNENKEACADLNKQIGIIGRIVQDLSRTKQIDYCKQTLEEVHECLKNCLKLIESITVKKGFFDKIKDFISSDSNKSLINKLTTQLRDMAAILNLALTAQTSNNVQQVMKLIAEKQKEKLPDIQKANKELEKGVDAFVQNINHVYNVSSSSSATASNTVNFVINSPTNQPRDGRDSPLLELQFQHTEENKRLYVLKRLKTLFRDRDKGEKTKNFQTYNNILENYKSELGYKDGQHTLYINDEPVSLANVLKEITKLISTVESTLKPSALPPSSLNPSGKEEARDKKEKSEPIVTAFDQLKLTGSKPSASTASSSSQTSLKLLAMDFIQTLALANEGDAMAQYQLGTFYLSGERGCLKNETKALEWFQKSATQGNGCALYRLGNMYENGLGGLGKDSTRALKLYQDAVERLIALKDDVFAQFNLGRMYSEGQGVPKDEKQGFACFEKAANHGHARAEYNLGVMHTHGQGVPKDDKKAKSWFERAANHGDVGAQYALGIVYSSGKDVPKDYKQAMFWYEKAAKQEHAGAQYALGAIYANGHGVAKDDRQALAWFERAANHGDAEAQFNVGVRYENGQGVPKDDKQAIVWFEKAANQGHALAQTFLRGASTRVARPIKNN